mmetsp:Transcript_53366/g.111374  ORF Transcript_53366/g.111374 Transcript_53366/m.111374 type:complete len:210 (+) Transcript_53366:1654-2283(+)
MERRLGNTIDIKMQTMNERLKEVFSTGHESQKRTDSLGKQLACVENKLESIAESLGITAQVSAGDDDLDRRRLKEKLREALEEENKHSKQKKLKGYALWMEHIFGICKPDGRIGKMGSRLVHPQSRFMQVILLLSGSLLFYTAIIVPVQLCLWNYDDPCSAFTTLYFDVFVHSFFLVIGTAENRACRGVCNFVAYCVCCLWNCIQYTVS